MDQHSSEQPMSPICGFLEVLEIGNRNFSLRTSCVAELLSSVCAGFPDNTTLEQVVRRVLDAGKEKELAWCCLVDGPMCDSQRLFRAVHEHTARWMPSSWRDVDNDEFELWHDTYNKRIAMTVCGSLYRSSVVDRLVAAAREMDRVSFYLLVPMVVNHGTRDSDMVDAWRVVDAIWKSADEHGMDKVDICADWIVPLWRVVRADSFYGHSFDSTLTLVQFYFTNKPYFAAGILRGTPEHGAKILCRLWKNVCVRFKLRPVDTNYAQAVHSLTRAFFADTTSVFKHGWKPVAEALVAICRTAGISRDTLLRTIALEGYADDWFDIEGQGETYLGAPRFWGIELLLTHVGGVLREAEQMRTLSRTFDAWLEISDVYHPEKFLGRRGRDEFEADMESAAASAASKAHRGSATVVV